MKKINKLPEAEFEIMKAVWANNGSATTSQIVELLKTEKNWTPQTVLTLLNRLAQRGFLSSSKQGKERLFTSVVQENEYLQFETGNFLRNFHKNSLTGLINALYDGKNLCDDEIEELQRWIDERK